MPCYHPLRAWRARKPGKNGRYPVVFNFDESCAQEVELPCGQCIGCRTDKAKEWALRCVHESQMYENNCFLTLTYADCHYPPTLIPHHFTTFVKRLRKKYVGKNPFHYETHPEERKAWQLKNGIRYFMCGEYGEQFSRPHYHALLFGYRPHDLEDFAKDWSISPSLEKIWGHGFVSVGDVTYDSAMYVASYVTKKITGDLAYDHYWWYDPYTDQEYPVEREYGRMSRNPGIGKGWLEKYGRDVYPEGYVVHNGNKYKPPRFYDDNWSSDYPDEIADIKAQRRRNIDLLEETDERRYTRERVHKAKVSFFKKRIIEDEY